MENLPVFGALVLTLYASGIRDSLEDQGGLPIYTLSPKDARAVLESAQAGEAQKMPTDIEDRTIPDGPHGDVSVLMFPT